MDSPVWNGIASGKAAGQNNPARKTACHPLSRCPLSPVAFAPADLKQNKDIVDDKEVYATRIATYVSPN